MSEFEDEYEISDYCAQKFDQVKEILNLNDWRLYKSFPRGSDLMAHVKNIYDMLDDPDQKMLIQDFLKDQKCFDYLKTLFLKKKTVKAHDTTLNALPIDPENLEFDVYEDEEMNNYSKYPGKQYHVYEDSFPNSYDLDRNDIESIRDRFPDLKNIDLNDDFMSNEQMQRIQEQEELIQKKKEQKRMEMEKQKEKDFISQLQYQEERRKQNLEQLEKEGLRRIEKEKQRLESFKNRIENDVQRNAKEYKEVLDNLKRSEQQHQIHSAVFASKPTKDLPSWMKPTTTTTTTTTSNRPMPLNPLISLEQSRKQEEEKAKAKQLQVEEKRKQLEEEEKKFLQNEMQRKLRKEKEQRTIEEAQKLLLAKNYQRNPHIGETITNRQNLLSRYENEFEQQKRIEKERLEEYERQMLEQEQMVEQRKLFEKQQFEQQRLDAQRLAEQQRQLEQEKLLEKQRLEQERLDAKQLMEQRRLEEEEEERIQKRHIQERIKREQQSNEIINLNDSDEETMEQQRPMHVDSDEETMEQQQPMHTDSDKETGFPSLRETLALQASQRENTQQYLTLQPNVQEEYEYIEEGQPIDSRSPSPFQKRESVETLQRPPEPRQPSQEYIRKRQRDNEQMDEQKQIDELTAKNYELFKQLSSFLDKKDLVMNQCYSQKYEIESIEIEMDALKKLMMKNLEKIETQIEKLKNNNDSMIINLQ